MMEKLLIIEFLMAERMQIILKMDISTVLMQPLFPKLGKDYDV
jgi:hypothetical protein